MLSLPARSRCNFMKRNGKETKNEEKAERLGNVRMDYDMHFIMLELQMQRRTTQKEITLFISILFSGNIRTRRQISAWASVSQTIGTFRAHRGIVSYFKRTWAHGCVQMSRIDFSSALDQYISSQWHTGCGAGNTFIHIDFTECINLFIHFKRYWAICK